MNPGNDIAVVYPNTADKSIPPIVSNANLYFFAWLAFCAAIFLSGSLAQEIAGINVRDVAAKAVRWYGLTAASLVVMGSSVRTFKATDCKAADNSGLELCKRTKFAVSMGVVGFVLAAVMTFLVQQKMQLTVCSELVITTLQLILWCFGVGYITFGKGPGAAIGNLFFSTWIAFILTVFLFAVSFREFVATREAANNNNGETSSPNQGEAPQPEFDDQN
jgi:hypothetical protein